MHRSSIHVHTTFCDGHDDIETFCRRAHEQRFGSIGFSAHAPIYQKAGIVSDWHLKDERLSEYIDAVHDARRRWEGKLRVFCGLEADYIEGRMGPGDFRDLDLDYIIGSVHYLLPPKGGEPFAVDGPVEQFDRAVGEQFDGDGRALLALYWDTLEGMIRAGGFDLLGHVDLIKKNNGPHVPQGHQGRWFSTEAPDYLNRFEKTAALIAASGIPAEVNTGGLNRGRTNEVYPSLSLLRILNTYQVPMTINDDAHEVLHLGGHYDTARDSLRAAGYTTILNFEGKSAGKAVWSEEAL
ncbi:histidinol-phosphatase [Spirochaetia bacterium]|nr:histidinol-phosphatase [Spirochaetia bacterium]